MANISIDQLANEIATAVSEYTEDVSTAIAKKTDEVADEVLKEIKTNHSYKDHSKYGYTGGWKKTKQDGQGKTTRIVWNKTNYRLVHLLEFGHANRGGGRTRAYPHVQPAYEKYGAKLPYHIRRIIERGGEA